MNLTKTSLKAFCTKTYWLATDKGWTLADYEGDVYKDDKGTYYLETPTGYTKVTYKDCLFDHSNPKTWDELDIMDEDEQMA